MSHAGNWHRNPRKLDMERSRQRLQRLPGWVQLNGEWRQDDSLNGVLARGVIITGSCSTSECRRRVEPDLRWWAEHGFGERKLSDLARAYVCVRMDCRFAWKPETNPRGVPIFAFTRDKQARVHVLCRYCDLKRAYTVEAFVAAMRKAGTGDQNTPAHLIGGAIRGACPRCDRRMWAVNLSTTEPRGPQPYKPASDAAEP